MRWLVFLALALLAAAQPAAAQLQEKTISGRAKVVDGGTIVIGTRWVRLDGIRAPGLKRTCHELRGRTQTPYPCGRHAHAFLSSLVARRAVFCVPTGKHRRGAVPGRCYVDGTDIARALVGAGWATVIGQRSRRYLSVQESARAAQRGMWAGSFNLKKGWPGFKKGRPGLKLR